MQDEIKDLPGEVYDFEEFYNTIKEQSMKHYFVINIATNKIEHIIESERELRSLLEEQPDFITSSNFAIYDVKRLNPVKRTLVTF